MNRALTVSFVVASLASHVGCSPDRYDPPPTTTGQSALSATGRPQGASTRVPKGPRATPGSAMREVPVEAIPPGPTFPRPEAPVPASQHSAHFMNKSTQRPSAAVGAPPPPVTRDAIAKQRDYLGKWDQLRASIADLPKDEQEKRRADLKRSVLGE